MSNPKGNPATLKSYTPKWNSGVTRTIRVPVALADEILDYAHKLDEGSLTQVNSDASDRLPAIAIASQDNNLTETLTRVIESLKQVCETSNTSKFTNKLKATIQQQVEILEDKNQKVEALENELAQAIFWIRELIKTIDTLDAALGLPPDKGSVIKQEIKKALQM